MYQDTAKLAQEIYDRSLSAVEVDWHRFQPMFDRAEPGWTPFEEPENYRWFLIKKFPVKDLDVTLKRLMADARDPGGEKFQHDRIIELWEKGAPEWPVFVTADGIIADGYHRTAAHRTLKHKDTQVVVSVMRPGVLGYGTMDEMWNEAFPRQS
jgi:hypothetical protein